MGSYCSILNDTEDNWSVKLGSDEAAIQISTWTFTAVGIAATAIATAGASAPLMTSLAANGVINVLGVSTGTLMAGSAVAAALPTAGLAGEKKTYGKMALSLWQQGTCCRTRVNPDNAKEILVEKLYMRPIFSGPTDNSDNVHTIQHWLDKRGVERVNTIQFDR
ncbi:hypothetical protein R1sor_003400 [Riccia sorocarpa]|uniref:Uncharacterized protein n=1 Tax=Riccia sorocarpa TaxID=122646 RepID=A0ABD3H1V8_9MARC